MNTYRTTSPRVGGRVVTTAVVGLVLLGLSWAPRALAMPIAPERGQGTVYLSPAQLRREAAPIGLSIFAGRQGSGPRRSELNDRPRKKKRQVGCSA